MPLPLDLRLALAPLDTYRELTAEPADSSWRRALERPALVAVIVGTAVTLSSAERVPVGLVAMGILCWSFVPALQLLVGAIVSGMAPSRSIGMARSIELLFMAQLPWSLWVLAMTGLHDVYRRAPAAGGPGVEPAHPWSLDIRDRVGVLSRLASAARRVRRDCSPLSTRR